ncbi:MAG: WGR domain-containing protein, partial [Planctomycetaceae bacterium]|nr:WGR domain-containing protein [Planctomycetaceae bacterium]
MIIRDLQKGKQKWQLVYQYNNSGMGYTVSNTSGREIEKQVTSWSEFTREFNKRIKQGWTETDVSISHRAFITGEDGNEKFWIIRLDGESYQLQYGKIGRYGYADHSGQTKVKYFDSAAEARLDYHKQIEKKLKEGYEEFQPRKTKYSKLPDDLQAQPKPKKKSRHQKAIQKKSLETNHRR